MTIKFFFCPSDCVHSRNEREYKRCLIKVEIQGQYHKWLTGQMGLQPVSTSLTVESHRSFSGYIFTDHPLNLQIASLHWSHTSLSNATRTRKERISDARRSEVWPRETLQSTYFDGWVLWTSDEMVSSLPKGINDNTGNIQLITSPGLFRDKRHGEERLETLEDFERSCCWKCRKRAGAPLQQFPSLVCQSSRGRKHLAMTRNWNYCPIGLIFDGIFEWQIVKCPG